MCQLVEAGGPLRPRIRSQERVSFDPWSSSRFYSMDGVLPAPPPRPSDSVSSSLLYVICSLFLKQKSAYLMFMAFLSWLPSPLTLDDHWLSHVICLICLLKGLSHEIEFKYLDKNELRRINIYWRLSTEILCGPRCLLFVHCVNSWFLYCSIF